MPFLSNDDMRARLDELTSTDLEESRRVEIINELGQQHTSGLSEQAELQANYDKQTSALDESRDAMAKMYNQLNAQNFGGGEGTPPEDDPQETITVEDLI